MDRQCALLGKLYGPAARRVREVEWLSVVDSTNARAWTILENCAGAALVLAKRQTAGRGRRSRSWESSSHDGLWYSLALELACTPPPALPLAVGAIVHDALVESGIRDLSLKWPNDLLCGPYKLAGVLVESRTRAARTSAVIGIGINWETPAVAGAIGLSAIQPTQDVSQVSVAAHLTNQLMALLDGGDMDQGVGDWLDYWRRHDAFLDTPVQLQGGAEPVEGVARGVDANGALRLETPSGVQYHHLGDLSLRGGP